MSLLLVFNIDRQTPVTWVTKAGIVVLRSEECEDRCVCKVNSGVVLFGQEYFFCEAEPQVYRPASML